MNKYKICLLGAFAVGKTSLVQQFVSSIFSEKYQTTLGVKIDKKSLRVGEEDVDLILWDLAGEDEFMKVRSSYLRGSAGALLVSDGTRGETLDIAIELKDKLQNEVGDIPFIFLINKSDVKEQWNIDSAKLDSLREQGWLVMETSAKSSNNVDEAFHSLASQIRNGVGK